MSPRLAVSYKKNNWKLRGAYGYGFRSPSFMESLIDWEHVQFGYTVIGNQNLKPEVFIKVVKTYFSIVENNIFESQKFTQ